MKYFISDMPPQTRKGSASKMAEYLGPSKDLLVSELPTLRNILCLGQLIMEEHSEDKTQMSVREMAKEVYSRVAAQYLRANAKFVPPVVYDENKVIEKVIKAWSDVSNILRKQKGAQRIHDKIQSELDSLFDFLHCHCGINCVDGDGNILPECKEEYCEVKLKHKYQINCTCEKQYKIPVLDLGFIRAQRLKIGDRSAYQMGLNDKVETNKQVKHLARKELDQSYKEKQIERVRRDEENNREGTDMAREFLQDLPDVAQDEQEDENESDTEFVSETRIRSKDQNRTNFPKVAAVSMQYGVSNRATAAIVTAAMVDLGLVTEEDTSMIIDHHKVAREMKKLMTELQKKATLNIGSLRTFFAFYLMEERTRQGCC